MMRAIFAIGLLVASLGVTFAQTQPQPPPLVIERIDITEYGIYTADTDNSSAAPGTASGTVDQLSGIALVQSTTAVPARLGVGFGFRYKIVGKPNAVVSLKNVTHVPAPGMRNPETGNVTLTNIFLQDRKVGGEFYRLYRFTNAWEIVPGLWTLELWYGDRKLLSQGFLIKKQ